MCLNRFIRLGTRLNDASEFLFTPASVIKRTRDETLIELISFLGASESGERPFARYTKSFPFEVCGARSPISNRREFHMKYLNGVSKFAAFLLMLAMPAVASAPIFTVNPFQAFVLTSGPDGCPFNVSFVPQEGRPNKGKVITFANGSSIDSGATFVTATNMTSNKSIDLSISGPAHFFVRDNTFTSYGPIFGIDIPNVGPTPPNFPTVAIATGQLVFQFDNFGNLLSDSYTGAAPQDICQLLE